MKEIKEKYYFEFKDRFEKEIKHGFEQSYFVGGYWNLSIEEEGKEKEKMLFEDICSEEKKIPFLFLSDNIYRFSKYERSTETSYNSKGFICSGKEGFKHEKEISITYKTKKLVKDVVEVKFETYLKGNGKELFDVYKSAKINGSNKDYEFNDLENKIKDFDLIKYVYIITIIKGLPELACFELKSYEKQKEFNKFKRDNKETKFFCFTNKFNVKSIYGTGKTYSNPIFDVCKNNSEKEILKEYYLKNKEEIINYLLKKYNSNEFKENYSKITGELGF